MGRVVTLALLLTLVLLLVPSRFKQSKRHALALLVLLVVPGMYCGMV